MMFSSKKKELKEILDVNITEQILSDSMDLPDIPPLKKRIDALTDEQIAEALIKGKGIFLAAARYVGQDRSNIGKRVKESPFLQAVVEQCKEARIDEAEESLQSLIMQRDLGAVCFILKTIGKKRGYVESVQHEIDPEAIANSRAIKEQLQAAREALAKKLEDI